MILARSEAKTQIVVATRWWPVFDLFVHCKGMLHHKESKKIADKLAYCLTVRPSDRAIFAGGPNFLVKLNVLLDKQL